MKKILNKKINKNKTKSILNMNIKYNNIIDFFKNNYENINNILSFILIIIIISVLYSVYSYYKKKKLEGFIEQEPYDLLDKIKSNIYKIDPSWDNQLYNHQLDKKESPLSFWNITKQDSNFKIIGHAVNNIANEFKDGQPVATKDKTMLIDGDTKVPESVKLIYALGDNQITEKRNNKGNLEFKTEYLNIKTLSDIEERLKLLENVYDVFRQGREEFKTRLLNQLNKELDKIEFKVFLYIKNNYFSVVNGIVTTNFNKKQYSSDGVYNCVRFPIGCDIDFTFENNAIIQFRPDFNLMLNDTGTFYAKLNYSNVLKTTNAEKINFSDNFGILENNGLNKSNEKIKKSHKSLIRQSTVARNRKISYPFNYMATNGTNNINIEKKGLYDYINNKIKSDRIDYIDGYDESLKGEINENKKINIIEANLDDKRINIITSETLNKEDKTITINNYREDNKIKRKDANLDKIIELEHVEPTTTPVKDKFEGFTTEKNTVKSIYNSKIHIGNSRTIKFDFSDIYEKMNIKLKEIINKEWFNIIKNNINALNTTNKDNNITDNPLGGIITKILTNSEIPDSEMKVTSNILTITLPEFYIDFVFNKPEVLVSFNHESFPAKWKSAITHAKKYKNARKRRNIGVEYYDQGNVAKTKTEIDQYTPVHTIKSIGKSFLKNISVVPSYSKEIHPLYACVIKFIYGNLDNLQKIEDDIINMTNSLNNLKNTILTNQFKHYPLKIYRPIPPPNYKTVGDLIFSQSSNFNNVDINFTADEPNLSDYACVPEQCVREIREWLPIDKIYEYQQDNNYLAIYRNPYLQTFRAVTTPGVLPSGKVEKIVACVERCKLVDDIIQADKCARTFYKTHKSISDTFNTDPDNVINERRNNIYKNKIVERQDRINKLKETSRQLQVQDDKANIVNKSYNRSKLQNLVDKQKINMYKLVDNLKNGKNKIAINVKFNYDKLFELCSNGKLPDNVCSFVQKNIKFPSSNLTDASRLQYDKKALEALLDSCPTPDMQNYVKRTLVENNCGCYFTDDELENNL